MGFAGAASTVNAANAFMHKANSAPPVNPYAQKPNPYAAVSKPGGFHGMAGVAHAANTFSHMKGPGH